MVDEPDLDVFAEELLRTVAAEAADHGDELLHPEALTRALMEYLEEAGEIDQGETCFHRARAVEVSGYAQSVDGATLDLFVTIFRSGLPIENLKRSEVDGAFRRLHEFALRCSDGYSTKLEEASPAYDMVLRVEEALPQVERLRFILLTNGIAKGDALPDATLKGKQVTFHIWDITRIFRTASSGQIREPIDIDFVDRFGAAVPCLFAEQAGGDFSVYLAILPGSVLAKLYAEYGTRLLELNVRSFLQLKGAVNKGIRDTILKQPDRFLAYNNGISATASKVERTPDGAGITRVSDLQIVNGGQTTASLFYALRKDRRDLAEIFVQAKLTMISPERLDEIVPQISRFSNTQNAVTAADFSSNHPFHVQLEKLSRAIWAPPPVGSHSQTRWFYERARGQYSDALAREKSVSAQNQFRLLHPPGQRFQKTDLAKFDHCWAQKPHIVSLGAQKNFREYMQYLEARQTFEPDVRYFQRVVAKAILFRETERIVSEQKFGGYRANIVAYTIALLSHVTSQLLDIDRIWREQQLTDEVRGVVRAMCVRVREVLTNPPNGRNVTEWCKKPECWQAVLSVKISLPDVFSAQLVVPTDAGATAQMDGEPVEIQAVAPGTWILLATWAYSTEQLAAWERTVATQLADLSKSGGEPTSRQLVAGTRVLQKAVALGFKPEKHEGAEGVSSE